MNTKSFNPISGKNSSGERFRFLVRSISQNSLYLPSGMMSSPHVRRLLDGESPCKVFGCDDISTARAAFHDLRMAYDFPFWAATHFFIDDSHDPARKVPLVLNRFQLYLADVITRADDSNSPGKFFITKSIPKCGLTTCIQAYFLWRQMYAHQLDASTITPDINSTFSLRYLWSTQLRKNDVHCQDQVNDRPLNSIFPIYEAKAGLKHACSFIHLADMMRWNDLVNPIFRNVFHDSLKACYRSHPSMFVVEGDTPQLDGLNLFLFRNYSSSEAYRLTLLSCNFKNPYFVYMYLLLTDPRMSSDYIYINLDKAMNL